MKLRLEQAGTAVLAATLAIALSLALPASGQDSSSAPTPSSAEPAAAATPETRPEAEIVAAGKRIWNDAACYNCHGNNAQGGHSTDFPNGPSLRKSELDPETMLTITECGTPETRMPAWLKGAYTEFECYGYDLGPPPTGTLLAGAYTKDQLKDLISYIQVNYMKQALPTWSEQQ